jgi:hypothetical protein
MLSIELISLWYEAFYEVDHELNNACSNTSHEAFFEASRLTSR